MTFWHKICPQGKIKRLSASVRLDFATLTIKDFDKSLDLHLFLKVSLPEAGNLARQLDCSYF